MKKYLLAILTLCFSAATYAQSISFAELTNFTSRTNGEVYEYLTDGRVFKQEYSQDVQGQKMDHYKNIHTQQKVETIVVGKYYKAADGSAIRTVNYTSTEPQDIINLIGQIKKSGLDQILHGADAKNNIYIFDNNFFHVIVNLSVAKNAGSVEIAQKEFVGAE